MLRRRRVVFDASSVAAVRAEPAAPSQSAPAEALSPRPATKATVFLSTLAALLTLLALPGLHHNLSAQFASPAEASLPQLLRATTSALAAANATHFLAPGAGLTPAFGGSARLPPRLHGLSISTLASESTRVLLAVAQLTAPSARPALAYAETHAGLRVYAAGLEEEEESAWDYRAPYVDLVALRSVQGLRGGYLVSGCCDCGKVTVSACAKTLCGCLVCAYGIEEVLPLGGLWVQGVGRVAVPSRREDVLLSVVERRRLEAEGLAGDWA